MDRNTKLTAFISLLLASAFFLSFALYERHQRDERLVKLSDDAWCKLKIAEAFPDFPVINYLGNVTNTAEERRVGGFPNFARILEWKSGQHPEYFRLFSVYQRVYDPVHWDHANHFHLGFITSDLEIYDIGLDPTLQ